MDTVDEEPLQAVAIIPIIDVFLFLFRRIVGKGSKVSFVLNQDFHSGYANENSTAYSILAHNVKGEVRLTVVSKQQKHSRKVFLYSRETDQRQFLQNFVY